MDTKPAIPFSDPHVTLLNRVGIVNHATYGQSQIIWFSKPILLLSMLAIGVSILMGLSLITLFSSVQRDRIVLILVVIIPFIVLFYFIINKMIKHNLHIELTDGKLLHVERAGDLDTILQQVSAVSIHSVSSEAASASPRISAEPQVLASASPYTRFPSILVCAEPTNITIKGPRRFKAKEVEFILSILDDYKRIRR